MNKKRKTLIRNFFIGIMLLTCMPSLADELPEGFVYLKDIIPDIDIELRYYSDDNFVGSRIDGYLASRCIITEEAALALQKVQSDLQTFGLGLKVYDAYRPQSAVNHFVRWAEHVEDTKMKSAYYPDVLKENLFEEGYIAEKSSHSRGSTVDVTIISLNTREELDMGSGFDFFGIESWPDHPHINASQRAHRMLLQVLMSRHGFTHYDKEWWHFTLRKEPFPDQYFDFFIR